MFIFDIYDNKSIGIIYVEDRGYVLFEKDSEDLNNVFLIKTDTVPAQYLVDNLAPQLLNNEVDKMHTFIQIEVRNYIKKIIIC